MTNILVQIIYTLICFIYLFISYCLWKTKNGLKYEFLMLFLALSWNAVVRAIEPTLPDRIPDDYIAFVATLPILFSGSYLVVYLWKKRKHL